MEEIVKWDNEKERERIRKKSSRKSGVVEGNSGVKGGGRKKEGNAGRDR